MFFSVLHLGSSWKLKTALALYMVIAWRINRPMRLGRTLPDLPADVQWCAAFILNKTPIPSPRPTRHPTDCPTLGFLVGRKGDGESRSIHTGCGGVRDLAVCVQCAFCARQIELAGLLL